MKSTFKSIGTGSVVAVAAFSLLGGLAYTSANFENKGERTPPAELLLELGLTAEEFKAQIEGGSTVRDIAEAKGIELPERVRKGKPSNRSGGEGNHQPPARLLEELGMTADELKAQIESGSTVREIAEAKGITLPERAEREGRPGNSQKKPGILKSLGLDEAEIETLKNDTSGRTVEQLLGEKGLTKEAVKATLKAEMNARFEEKFEEMYAAMKDKEIAEILSKRGAPQGEE